MNFLVSTHQVILGWATRFKIIDPDSKQDVGDEIVGHVFVIISIVLIYRLSYTIYIKRKAGIINPSFFNLENIL